jgi:hypothetical protein
MEHQKSAVLQCKFAYLPADHLIYSTLHQNARAGSRTTPAKRTSGRSALPFSRSLLVALRSSTARPSNSLPLTTSNAIGSAPSVLSCRELTALSLTCIAATDSGQVGGDLEHLRSCRAPAHAHAFAKCGPPLHGCRRARRCILDCGSGRATAFATSPWCARSTSRGPPRATSGQGAKRRRDPVTVGDPLCARPWEGEHARCRA